MEGYLCYELICIYESIIFNNCGSRITCNCFRLENNPAGSWANGPFNIPSRLRVWSTRSKPIIGDIWARESRTILEFYVYRLQCSLRWSPHKRSYHCPPFCRRSLGKRHPWSMSFLSPNFAMVFWHFFQIGGGTLSDLFRAKDRGKAVAIYSWSPILAPLVGAIIGGFISQNINWQWTFYISSFLSIAIQILGLFFLEETYPPLLLRRKKARQMQATGANNLYTEFDYLDEGRMKVLSTNLLRPFKLLATQPIIQVLALYNAYLYGNIYMLYADFINLWTEVYGESIEIAGLNYISIAIGSAIAAECCTLINDRLYRGLSKRNRGKGIPEFRIPIMLPATLFLSAGMFWYGWTAEIKMHWIMPNIGTSIFVAGALACTISINAYVIDTYGQYSASGLAAVSTIRCLAGFTFPMFAPKMWVYSVIILFFEPLLIFKGTLHWDMVGQEAFLGSLALALGSPLRSYWDYTESTSAVKAHMPLNLSDHSATCF